MLVTEIFSIRPIRDEGRFPRVRIWLVPRTLTWPLSSRRFSGAYRLQDTARNLMIELGQQHRFPTAKETE